MISTTRCPIFFNAVYITFNATYTFFHQSSLDCKICLSHFFNFFQLCRLPDLGKDGWAFFTPPLCRRLLCTTIRACLLTKKRKLKSVKIFLTIPSKKDLHVKLWNMKDVIWKKKTTDVILLRSTKKSDFLIPFFRWDYNLVPNLFAKLINRMSFNFILNNNFLSDH